MTHSRSRAEYEFDRETKLAALEKHEYRCEKCGAADERTNRLHADHIVAIWFVRETGCLGTEVIKSICNCQILCQDCHTAKHKAESRAYYAELAPVVLQRYLAMTVNHQLDDWREKLK